MSTFVEDLSNEDLAWGIGYESNREAEMWDVLETRDWESGSADREDHVATIRMQRGLVEDMVVEAIRRMEAAA